MDNEFDGPAGHTFEGVDSMSAWHYCPTAGENVRVLEEYFDPNDTLVRVSTCQGCFRTWDNYSD